LSTALDIDLSTIPIVLLPAPMLLLLPILTPTLLPTPATYRANLEKKKKNNNKIEAVKLTLFFSFFFSL